MASTGNIPASERPCYRCGERPRHLGHSYCKECQRDSGRRSNPPKRDLAELDELARRREAGLCSRCGERPRHKSESWCSECQNEALKPTTLAWREANAERYAEYQRQYSRDRREQAKADRARVIELERLLAEPQATQADS